jgi:hypothetical protein
MILDNVYMFQYNIYASTEGLNLKESMMKIF